MPDVLYDHPLKAFGLQSIHLRSSDFSQIISKISALRTDINLVVIHLDIIASHTIPPTIRPEPTSYVKLLMMPRTSDHIAFEFTFDQRAAFMWADIIDCKKLSGHIEQRDTFSVHLHHSRSARRNIFYSSNCNKLV